MADSASPATSQDEQLAVNLYAVLMREIKLRISTIRTKLEPLRSAKPTPSGFLDAEFCVLQIRMICELVALASLAAHSPLKLSKQLLKGWHADRMFSDLEKINSHCFPNPVCVESWNRGKVAFASGNYIKVQDLRTTYAKCGEHLHRRKLRPLLDGKPKSINIKWVRDRTAEFVDLLLNHMIYIEQLETFFVASMNAEPNGDIDVSLLRLTERPTAKG